MKTKLMFLVIVMGVSALVTAQPDAPDLSNAECEVWNREVSFSETVVNRDIEAFTSHLHPDTVFLAGNTPMRGPEQVLQRWRSIVLQENGLLRWHPQVVVVAGDTGIALSRGPYWYADPRPEAEQPFLRGNYISTWVQSADGDWHVLFDDGGASPPRPASAEEISKLEQALLHPCPN